MELRTLADKCLDPIQAMDGGRDHQIILARQSDLQPAVGQSVDRHDLIPKDLALSINEAVRIDADRVSLLHPPTDHCEDLDDQKPAREDEIRNTLPNSIEDQVEDEEEKRQQGHDRRSLKQRGRSRVNGNEFSKF